MVWLKYSEIKRTMEQKQRIKMIVAPAEISKFLSGSTQ